MLNRRDRCSVTSWKQVRKNEFHCLIFFAWQANALLNLLGSLPLAIVSPLASFNLKSIFLNIVTDQSREEETRSGRRLRIVVDAALQAREGVRVHHGQQSHSHPQQLPRDRPRSSQD